ncbi:MAG TPA: hypothetical protein VNJ12_05695 [Candidatus Dormibacteraeota bacterium]|nr:hypothetical protein [Candidatus Dormibacteraeota bacterium]
MESGATQRRKAERTGDEIRLSLVVDGGEELASVSTWIVSKASGQISLSIKEARYEQVRDYGRVLLNQVIEATGTVR